MGIIQFYTRIFDEGERIGIDADPFGVFTVNGHELPIVTGHSVSFDISCDTVEVTTHEDWAKNERRYAPGQTHARLMLNGNMYNAIGYSINKESGAYRVAFVPIAGMQPVQIVIPT